jgi:pyridoxamine 5'-phosphate oxidase
MKVSQAIADIRKEYKLRELSEDSIAQDPLEQFDRWWNEATASGIDEVNAMTLATISADGLPDARIVLLKGYDPAGFVFFTNYESRKGKELGVHPVATLVFFWKELERQVRIGGRVEKIDPGESDAYFHTRPRGSRLGAWASPQSDAIPGREVLDENLKKLEEKFREGAIPRPPHWGGYRVIPDVMEFWQGRPSRLHDRLQYTRPGAASGWIITRLAP